MTDISGPVTPDLDPLQFPQWKVGRDASTWPTLKVARAAQHASDLQGLIMLWAARRPMDTKGKLADDRLTWQLFLMVVSPPPVEEWSLILGDLIHNLRSSLDACVWEFAHRDGRTAPRPRQVQFPIVQIEADWPNAQRNQLQTVPSEFAERVRILQPFNRPEDERERDALVLLQDLSNLDKHRSTIKVSLTLESLNADMGLDFASVEAAERNVPPQVQYFTPEFRDGALLVEHKTIDPIIGVSGGYDVKFNFMVETPIGPQPLTTVTQNLLNYVQQVLAVLYGGAVKDDGGSEQTETPTP